MKLDQATELTEKIVTDDAIQCFWDYLNPVFRNEVVASIFGIISTEDPAEVKVAMIRDVLVLNSGEWYRDTLTSATQHWEETIDSFAPQKPAQVAPPQPEIKTPPKAPEPKPIEQKEPQLTPPKEEPINVPPTRPRKPSEREGRAK